MTTSIIHLDRKNLASQQMLTNLKLLPILLTLLLVGCPSSDFPNSIQTSSQEGHSLAASKPNTTSIAEVQRSGATKLIPQTEFSPHNDKQRNKGLFYSDEELKQWNERRLSGPFKENWDNRIMPNAKLFMAGKKDLIPWSGRIKPGCHPGTTEGEYPGDRERTRTAGMWANSAAFVYRVLTYAGETERAKPYFEKVKQYLISHTYKPGIDFRDRRKWCDKTITVQGVHQFIAAWFRRIAITYSWIKEDMTRGERERFEYWLSGAGKFYSKRNEWQVKHYIENRYDPVPKCRKKNCVGALISDQLYSGGPPHYQINDSWNNRDSAVASAVGIVGIVTGDIELVNNATIFFKEALKYSVWPDGAYVDIIRTHPTPANAFSYPMDFLGSMTTLADALARAGNTNLYDFATDQGIAETASKPKETKKSIKRVIQHLAGQVDGTIIKYGTGKPHTPDNVINPANGGQYGESWADLYLIQSNIYYRSEYIRGIYTRTGSGTQPRRTKSVAGWDQYTGDWGTYPDIQFMWSGLEGKIWPYSVNPQNDTRSDTPITCQSDNKICSSNTETR